MLYLDPRLGNEVLVSCLHCQLQTVAPTPSFTGIDQKLLGQVLVIAVTLSEQLYKGTGLSDAQSFPGLAHMCEHQEQIFLVGSKPWEWHLDRLPASHLGRSAPKLLTSFNFWMRLLYKFGPKIKL